MSKSARYDKVDMTDLTSEEAHLLARLEELEDRCDKLQTIVTEHKHENDRVVIDADWAL